LAAPPKRIHEVRAGGHAKGLEKHLFYRAIVDAVRALQIDRTRVGGAVMSKVVRFHAIGGPEVLQIDELEVGDPGPGEVRLAVGAIGLNRVEAMFRSGEMGVPRLPSRIGYEAAGTVEALGAGVGDFQVGDRVAVLSGLSMEDYGVCADTALYPADMLIRQPDNLSVEQSAAAWMQYLTAYAILGVADLKAGEPVLITAASSSVGLAAIQIANLVGAVPIAATRGRAKAEALLEHGAAHVIVGEEEGIVEGVRRLTEGRGVRVIFDAVAGDTLPALVEAACPHGWIIVYGTLAGAVAPIPLHFAMLKGLTIRGYAMNDFMADLTQRRRALDFIYHGLGTGRLKPVIDQVFPIEQVADAYRRLEGNAQIGKILVRAR
jgi:NADPH:quinone reductase-like Zn-dependent oxidoreductase